MRRLMWIVVLLLFRPLQTQAVDANWQAWLVMNNQLTLIDSNGAVLRTTNLPYVGRFDDSVYYRSQFSPDGRYVAYTSRSALQASAKDQLIVYDLFRNQIIMQKDGGGSDLHFNQSGDELAYFATSDSPYFLQIVHVPDGKIVYGQPLDWDRLKRNFPEQPSQYLSIRQFDDGWIELYLNAAIKGATFMWSHDSMMMLDDTANEVQDRLDRTGEKLVAFNDYQFMGITGKPLEFNTLQLFDPTRKTFKPIYVGLNDTYGDAYFVQHGEKIILRQWVTKTRSHYQRGYPPVEDNWLLLDRDGHIQDKLTLPTNRYAGNIHRTATGFIYTLFQAKATDIRSISLPSVFEMDTRNGFGQSRMVWTVEASMVSSFIGRNRRRLNIGWVG